MNPVPFLHGFVIANTFSQNSVRECLTLANIFSDSTKRVSHSICYGSLANTRFWFQDESHILQNLKQSEFHLSKKIVFGENLLQTFFFGILTTHTGIHFLNKNSLQLKRMLKLITWKQWAHAAQQFATAINTPNAEKEKNIASLSKFTNQMQELRVSKPALMPAGIDKNELDARFGSFVASMWMEWSNKEFHPWILNSTEMPIHPEDFATSSDDILPGNTAIAIHEVNKIGRETFFKAVERISTLNTPFDTNGILDFTCLLHANNNVSIETELHLAAPLFKRHKTSEHVFQSCANIISKNIKNPPNEANSQGVKIVPEIAWIERIEIIPRSIVTQQNTSFFLFETDDFQKTLEIKNSLLLKEIGNVFNPPETEHNTLYAFSQRTENFIRLRNPKSFSFTNGSPERVVFAKTDGDRDFFQVFFLNNENIFCMSTPTKLRNKPFSDREPIWHGFCAIPIEDIAKQ